MSKIISFNSNIPEGSYNRAFGKKDIKIEYQRNPPEQGSSINSCITLIDDNGKKIEKITSYHKNKIYKQAKELQGELSESMCTKTECWNPNKENVNKMIKEMRNPKIQAYKLAMKVIGADPKDYNPELLRRGR